MNPKSKYYGKTYIERRKTLKNLCDDDLFNKLQKVRVDLYCERASIDGINQERLKHLEQKYEYICLLLEERGLDAHKQF